MLNVQYGIAISMLLQLHTAVGRNEAIYKIFTFHGIRIWNYISTKISVDVSYASFKHSSKLFIKNNPIPYRVT